MPARTVLGANYPNPFNPQTLIPFTLAADGRVSMSVYDARGRLVRQLSDRNFAAGAHTLRWDGTDDSGRALPSGTYFARLRDASAEVRTTGLVLVR